MRLLTTFIEGMMPMEPGVGFFARYDEPTCTRLQYPHLTLSQWAHFVSVFCFMEQELRKCWIYVSLLSACNAATGTMVYKYHGMQVLAYETQREGDECCCFD
jgi:hypothetical protein